MNYMTFFSSEICLNNTNYINYMNYKGVLLSVIHKLHAYALDCKTSRAKCLETPSSELKWQRTAMTTKRHLMAGTAMEVSTFSP